MPRLHLVADVINHCEELMQNYSVRSINANNVGNRLYLAIFFQANIKEDAMLLVTGFATVSQIANHCQIRCCIKILLQMS